MTTAISQSVVDETPERRRTWILLWVGIAMLALGPIVGMLGTALGMLDSFRTIEGKAAPTPDDLAVGVHVSQFATTAGLAAGLIGLVLVVVAIIRLSRANSRPA